MSEGLNKVFLLGNLGADPELRFTQGGQAVLNLRLATNEGWFDKDQDKRVERTEWHNVTVWGKRAEGLAKILHKGGRLHVEGSLRTSSYEKDGTKHYKTEIVAVEVLLLDGAPKGENRDEPPAGKGGKSSAAPARGGRPARGDDNIPF